MADSRFLTVRLHGKTIGSITHLGGDRTIFALEESYLADSNRPTLGLRFKDALGELIADFRPTQTKLIPFFSNLLPEGPLRRFLADRAGVHPDREFHLLRALGRDLPGAVTVWADDDRTPGDTTGTAQSAIPAGGTEDALRFSLAGVQLKFSAIKAERGGLTIPASGAGGNWIVKLPAQAYPHVPENEFSMMTLAAGLGITVPRIALVDTAAIGNLPVGMERLGLKSFAVERFDRRADSQPVHMEDFAQVFGVYPEDKYRKASFRNLAVVIAAEAGLADIAEFIRRVTFTVLIDNGDMHLKNWSLIYPDARRARLAPAYDFVSTLAYIANEKSALNFSRVKEFDGFTDDELRHLAAKASLPHRFVLDTAHETVTRFLDLWAAEKTHLPMDGAVRDAIDTHLARLPIIREV